MSKRGATSMRTSGYEQARATGTRASSPRARRAAYTLIELMIVVAITGVLAALAIPAFSGYLQKGRTTEAVNFLGVIKLRQEAYRSEFGMYASDGTANVASIRFIPGDASVMRDAVFMPWPTDNAVFNALGARPDSSGVRFGYGIVAGTPAQADGSGSGTNLTGAPYDVPAGQVDFYFISQAVTDLDGDGVALTFELTSFTRSIWVSDAAKGWE